MDELTHIAGVSVDLPLEKTNSKYYEEYKHLELPWGRTCKEWESYLKDIGRRAEWDRRVNEIQKERGCRRHEALWAGHLEFTPERLAAEMVPLSATVAQFVDRCKEALRMPLKERVGVERELDWIGANIHQVLPDIRRAPSLFAVNWLIACKSDENVYKNFWSTVLSKRMSPGDSKKKAASSVSEDQVDESAEIHEDHLRRLLGDG